MFQDICSRCEQGTLSPHLVSLQTRGALGTVYVQNHRTWPWQQNRLYEVVQGIRTWGLPRDFSQLPALHRQGALSMIICKSVANPMFLTFLTKLSFLKITSQRSVLIFHPFVTLQTQLWKNYQFSKPWIHSSRPYYYFLLVFPLNSVSLIIHYTVIIPYLSVLTPHADYEYLEDRNQIW